MRFIMSLILFLSIFSFTVLGTTKQVHANICNCANCCGVIAQCASTCVCTSDLQRDVTMKHITKAFEVHRLWMVEIFFGDKRPGVMSKSGDASIRDRNAGLLEMLAVMASQFTAAAVDQVMMIATLLDAKHQMETQRVFQKMTAQAHKDYHPSEGLCEFGTVARDLASAQRKTNAVKLGLANRMNERQNLTGTTTSENGDESDMWTRLNNFVETYCNPSDGGFSEDDGYGLENLCTDSQADKKRYNKDIHYAHTVGTPLTLELDFTPNSVAPTTEDEQDVLALTANLFYSDPLPKLDRKVLLTKKNEPSENSWVYMDSRALTAKRSVAQNSIAAIAAEKAEGNEEGKTFIYAVLKELGGDSLSDDEIIKLLGEKPSYFAQMEVLTKKIYQNPVFYTELLDKPANVHRKEVAVQAIELMQKRDIYRALLRTEALYATMVEASLIDIQREVETELDRLDQKGVLRKK